jgi:hypothetical protein
MRQISYDSLNCATWLAQSQEALMFCLKEQLWRACNLTAISHSSTGPVVHLVASHHEGPGFNPQGGTYLKPGFSC